MALMLWPECTVDAIDVLLVLNVHLEPYLGNIVIE